MGTALLEVQRDVTALRGVFGCVVQQVQQDVRHVFLVDLCTHLRGVDGQRDILLHLVANLVHQTLAEGWDRGLFQFYALLGAALQLRQRLDMVGEIGQRLHLGNTAVEFL